MVKYLLGIFFLLAPAVGFSQSWVPVNAPDSSIYALTTFNQSMYAGGDFHSSSGYPISPHVAVLTSRNTWQSLGSGLDSTVYCFTTFGNTLYAGGAFNKKDGGQISYVAQWDGTQWQPAGSKINGVVYCLSVFNGFLYAGGSFSGPSGLTCLARYNGFEWVPVGGGVDNVVYAMAVYQGNLYVAGGITQAGTVGVNFIARWDGSTWSPVGSSGIDGVDATIHSLQVFNGNLYVGGEFFNAAGVPASHLARWNGTSWSGVNGGINGDILTFSSYDSLLYIGGSFTLAGGKGCNNIITWNDTSFAPLGLGLKGGTVTALVNFNNDLYAGGTFKTAGLIDSKYLAKWSSQGSASALSVFSAWDRDGNLSTLNDRSGKAWNLSIYKDSINNSTLVASGNTTLLSLNITQPGRYIVMEADSGGDWTRINGSHRLIDTFDIPLNTTILDSFINFHTNLALSVSFISGWNLASNPLNEGSQLVTSLFPEAITNAFTYDRLHGYTSSPSVTNGNGFWLKFPAPAVDTLSGVEITSITLPLAAGWNLLGSISSRVPVSSVIQSPSNIINSPYYEYIGGYHQADTIVPGKGYWIKSKQNGQVTVQSGSFAKGSPRALPSIHSLTTLIISDVRRQSGTLYIGDAQNGAPELSYFELPPLPPAGLFDVRFSTQNCAELFTPGTSSQISGTLQITAAKYPVTISWSVPADDINTYLLYNASGGNVVAELRGQGSAVLDGEVPGLRIRKSAAAGALPKEFSLHQNYPNPFNPTTSIKFELPADAVVTLAVYDQLGRIVTMLFDNSRLDAGVHEAFWNSVNNASGVYFYRIIASPEHGLRTFTDVKKMVMLR